MQERFKAHLQGSVATKPDFKYSADGMALIRFRVVQGRKDEEKRLCKFGISAVAFESAAEDLNKVLEQGDGVTMFGYFQSRYYYGKDPGGAALPAVPENRRYDDSFIVQKIIVERDGREYVVEAPKKEHKPLPLPVTK